MNQVAKRLAELLGAPHSEAEVEWHPSVSGQNDGHADVKVTVGGFKFLVEWKSSGTAAMIAMAVRTVLEFAENSRESYSGSFEQSWRHSVSVLQIGVRCED